VYSVPFFPAILVDVGAAALVDGSIAIEDVIADDEDDDAELPEVELFDW
jgi:hypothetical protein